MWAVSWQGAQDVKRSERPRPVSAGAAARNHAPTYDTKLLTLTLDARAPKGQAKVSLERGATPGSLGGRLLSAFEPLRCPIWVALGWSPGRFTCLINLLSLKRTSRAVVERSFSRKLMPRRGCRHLLDL